jgi:hypothetical protein
MESGCRFFEWFEEKKSVVCKLDFPEEKKKRPALPGFATYLSDWNKMDTVKKMMSADLQFMSSYTDARYNDIEVGYGISEIQVDKKSEE